LPPMCSHHSSSKRTSDRSLPAPRTLSKRSRAKVSTRRSSASTKRVSTATISSAEPRVPSFAMDRPVLHAFVDELVEHERLSAFAEALPTRARVSEPALPLLLASLHERLGAARGPDEVAPELGSGGARTCGLVS